jgi:hypothetical protein
MVWQGRGMRSCLALVAIYGMTIQIPNQVQAQSSTAPMSEKKLVAEPDKHIIPSLQVAERYDSNVFFVPGTNLEDYVTTVSPQLKLNHRNQWVEGKVGGGATGEVYAKNSGLNYVGGNGTVDLNLDGAINKFIHGVALRVADTISYTPQLQSFATSSADAQGIDSFIRGLQAQRANSFVNIGTVQGSYTFSSSMSFTSIYTDQRLRFGNAIATPSGSVPRGLIDTNFQTVTSGPVVNLSPSDTVSLSHLYQHGTFGDGGTQSSFSIHGATGKWSRSMTPALQATVEGGFAVISSSGNVQSTGAASLRWQGEYTTVLVSYSRAITPSFLVASTALLSQVVTGAVNRQITGPLSLSLSGSYAVNESIPDSSLLRFESYSITPSIYYLIGKTFTTRLSYTHSQFEQTFASQTFPFDRNLVQLSMTAEWK